MRYHRLLAATALVMAGCQSNTGESPVETSPFRPSTTTIRPSTTTNRPSTTTSSISTSTTISVDLSFVAEMFPIADDALEVRDCYDRGYYARSVECESPHDGQIIGRVVLEKSLLHEKDKDVWLTAIDKQCAYAFEEFRGGEPPSRDGQSLGSGSFVLDAVVLPVSLLQIYCTVVLRNGTKWTGSAEIAVGLYEYVGVGDCFNPPTQLDDAEVVPCSEPHYAEMFLKNAQIGLNDELDPYPSNSEWEEIQERLCLKPFMQYTGKRYEDVGYSFALIYPIETEWKDLASRTVSCAITSGTGQQWVGSKRK